MISLILAKKILSLFLVMALGIVLVRCGIVRSRDSKVLSMISLYLVMPCVIISSFQVEYQPEILNGLLLALATAVLLHLVLIVVVGFLGKVLKLDGVEETSLIYSNAGNLIIPIVTAILGKVGISGVESNLGTAIRTGVVLVMSWVMVFVTGKQEELKAIPKNELGFICLSGLATGGSWLCYYKALQDGPASVVAPIDKLSILVTILFSYLVFHEKLTKKAALGLTLVVAGTLLMLL